MRVGRVIGTVTLVQAHPLLAGARLRLAVPWGLPQLRGASDESQEEFVVFDELGAGIGQVIAIAEGGEAANPFWPQFKPIDAYNAAILDRVSADGRLPGEAE